MGGGYSRRAPDVVIDHATMPSLSRVPSLVVSTEHNETHIHRAFNGTPGRAPDDDTAVAAHSESSFILPQSDMITPRREMQMRSSVSCTPHGEQALEFPYYCPLCMEHFSDIFVSECCNNYTCLQCCIEYLGTQSIKSDSASINEVLGRVHAKAKSSAGGSDGDGTILQCPHCRQAGYCPSKVALGGQVRNYATTPCASKVRDIDEFTPSFDSLSEFGVTTGSANLMPLVMAPSHSPIRVGDSFDSLKRKMRHFQAPSAHSQPIPINSDTLPALSQSHARVKMTAEIGSSANPLEAGFVHPASPVPLNGQGLSQILYTLPAHSNQDQDTHILSDQSAADAGTEDYSSTLSLLFSDKEELDVQVQVEQSDDGNFLASSVVQHSEVATIALVGRVSDKEIDGGICNVE